MEQVGEQSSQSPLSSGNFPLGHYGSHTLFSFKNFGGHIKRHLFSKYPYSPSHYEHASSASELLQFKQVKWQLSQLFTLAKVLIGQV